MTRVVVMLLLLVRVASAEDPWAVGVAPHDQTRANELFAEANTLFAQQAHAPALDKYRAAVALWDHPLIRFNMAVTLIRLDRMLEAADALDGALRFGEQPFTPAVYAQALDYQKLVNGRVGTIEVTCAQPGARVLLDGKPWFTCPGTRKQRVVVGQHTVLGEHRAFMSKVIEAAIGGGVVTKMRVELVSLESTLVEERRFGAWVPWTVIGVGATTMLAGFYLLGTASSQIELFEREVAMTCPEGCVLEAVRPDLVQMRKDAHEVGDVGSGVMVAGVVGISVGVMLVVLNIPRKRLPKLDVAPTQGGASASASWRF